MPAEVERLSAQTNNTAGRERILEFLAKALAYLTPPAPYQRPIACLEDWSSRSMHAQRKSIDFQRVFSTQKIAQVIRNLISEVMAQR